MKLLNLTVENIGLYRGPNSFDLSTTSTPDSTENVVLFTGTNGAGKSTLYVALMVGIYGQHALGDKITQRQYDEFILQRMHKRMHFGKPVTESKALIGVSLEYVRSGRQLVIDIERQFVRKANRVTETVAVREDGKPIPVDINSRQAWLEDHFPYNQLQLCFFDAEQLELMSNLDQDGEALGGLMRRYLGIDIVDRLYSDLESYSLRQGGHSNLSRLSTAVGQLQAELDYFDAQIAAQRDNLSQIDNRELSVRANLAVQERKLQAEGGEFSRRRPQLQMRLSEVNHEIRLAETAIREQCAGLLPFALCPGLCAKLDVALEAEARVQLIRSARQVWQYKLADVERVLAGATLWKGLTISEPERTELATRLLSAVGLDDVCDASVSEDIIHNLSELDQLRIRQWILDSRGAFPQLVMDSGQHLAGLSHERLSILSELNSVPSEDVLAPIHAAILELQTELEHIRKERSTQLEQIGSLQYARDEKARLKNRTVEEFEAAQAADMRLRLVTHSKRVLRSYKQALVRSKLHQFEHALVKCFNTLCRKESLLAHANIDEDTYALTLHDAHDKPFRLMSLSAGERQLFAYAFLWAMREGCGQPLPLVIDTPVARLDEVHRDRVLNRLLPVISRQVLLFATSAEIDGPTIRQVDGMTSRVFYLNYCPDDNITTVSPTPCQVNKTYAIVAEAG